MIDLPRSKRPEIVSEPVMGCTPTAPKDGEQTPGIGVALVVLGRAGVSVFFSQALALPTTEHSGSE